MKATTFLQKTVKAICLTAAGALILVCGLIAVLYSPWAQKTLLDAVLHRFGNMPDGTVLSIGDLSLRFPAHLEVESLSISQSGDTLVAAGSLHASVNPLGLFAGRVNLREATLTGGRYRIGTPDSSMFMTIAADSIALAPVTVGLSDMNIALSEAFVGGGRLSMALRPDTMPSPPSQPSEMKISVERLTLDRFGYSMRMLPTIDTLNAYISSAELQRARIDMAGQSVNLGIFGGHGLDVRYIMPDSATTAAASVAQNTATTDDTDSSGSPWTISIDSLRFDRSRALYTSSGYTPLPGLDFAYISVDDLSLHLHDFLNRGTTLCIPLHMEGRERCGVRLNTAGTLGIDSAAIRFLDFTLSTEAGSEASFDGLLGMGDMSSDPFLPLALTMESKFVASDLQKMFPAFMPFLAGIPERNPVEIRTDVSGTTGHLDINSAMLRINRCITVSADGYAGNFMNPAELKADISLGGSITDISTIKNHILGPDAASQLNIPPMTLRGHFGMNNGMAHGNLVAVTHSGDIRLNGVWNSRHEDYTLDLNTNTLPLQLFMPLLETDALTAEIHAQGHGYNPFVRTTTLDASAAVSSVTYRGAVYTDIGATAHLADGQASVRFDSSNPEADITLDASGNLDGGTYIWTADIDGRNIDLQALGMSAEPCTVEINAGIDAAITPEEKAYEARLTLNELYFRRLSGSIVLNNVDASLKTADSTSLRIVNRDMTASFDAPCSLDTLTSRFGNTAAIMQRLAATYTINADSISGSLPPFSLAVDAGASNMINDILSVYGMSIRSLRMRAANDSIFNLDVAARRFATTGMTLDSLYVNGRQHGGHMHFNAGMENRPGNLDQWHKVVLDGRIEDNRANLKINQRNLQGRTGFDLGIMLTAEAADSTLTLNINPFEPVIGYRPWTVNSDNYASYHIPDSSITANLHMNSGASSIAVFTEARDTVVTDSLHNRNDLVLQLKNILIQDWISLNPFAPSIKGSVSADLRLNRRDGSFVGNGTAGISDFIYGRQHVADINADFDIKASSDGSLRANANMAVNGTKTITVRGTLNDSTATSPLDLDFSMIRFPLATVNPFLPSRTGRLSGTLNGSLHITGTSIEPVMNGFLAFDSTRVDVTMLGSSLTFSNERIPVDNSVVTFDRYAITACNDNPLTIDGTVDLGNISDVNMDLRFEADEMQLVDSRRATRGADVYGKAFIGMDARVRGSMSFMSVDADMSIQPGTNITYVMPEATAELTSYSNSEMVKFVNFTDTLATEAADSIAPSGTMMLVDATLTVEEGSTIGVDLSSDGKNKVQVESNGILTFTMTPMNTGRLTGRLNIENGFARYGQAPILSEQTFNFTGGSYIAFSGNIMNPSFDIGAVNVVKANVTQEGANSRLVNFDIGLNVSGSLNRMNVTFDLSTRDDISVANELESMTPEQRANQAMNLMLYKIYTGAGTKANASLSNPLYGFLAGQLNSWAANNIKGVDISFGIDQYDKTVDGSTSQTTSYSYQVSKSLFNDRFKIVVGGNYSTDANSDENFSQNLVNDISFEYFLNNTRTMYVRLFRHTGYESILEGEITQTGVGFVYRRKLSRLGDMFLTPKRVKARIEREKASTEVTDNGQK